MTMPTAQGYGAPPVALTAMADGATVGMPAVNNPIIKFGASTYAVILLVIAALYFWKGRK